MQADSPYVDIDFISRQAMGCTNEAGLTNTSQLVCCCNHLVGFCLQLVCKCSWLALLRCYDTTVEDLDTSGLDRKYLSQVGYVFSTDLFAFKYDRLLLRPVWRRSSGT